MTKQQTNLIEVKHVTDMDSGNTKISHIVFTLATVASVIFYI